LFAFLDLVDRTVADLARARQKDKK